MMKKTKIILPALAVVLVLGLMVGPALAYFTAHTEAAGSTAVSLGAQTDIDEKIVDNQKLVTIKNDGPQAVWVRVKAYSAYPLTYEDTTGWTEQDGYYVYDQILEAGQTTDKDGNPSFVVTIDTNAADAANVEDFNVIVVYECTPVEYNADGTTKDADWDMDITPATTQPETTEGGES